MPQCLHYTLWDTIGYEIIGFLKKIQKPYVEFSKWFTLHQNFFFFHEYHFFGGILCIRVSSIPNFFLNFWNSQHPSIKNVFHLDKVLNTGSLDFDCCSTCELNKFEFKGVQVDPFCCCCCWEVEKLSNMGNCFNGLFEPWILSSEPPRPLPMAALLAFCCLSCSLAASSKLWIKWHLGP